MYQRYKGRGKYTYKRMQEQNYKTVPSEREKLNIKVDDGKQSAFNCVTVEQDRRSTINVILRRVRVTILAVENQ